MQGKQNLEMNGDILPGLVGLGLGALLVFLGIQAYALWQKKLAIKEKREEAFRTLIPLRLQAYERLVLLLERISPEQLIARMPEEGRDGPAWVAQQWIVQSIREEFQHNITQQIYVEEATWIKIRESVDQLIWQVNQIPAQLSAEADGRTFLKTWVRFRMDHPNILEDALSSIRQDIQKEWRGE